jgi:hypothetical protein
LSDAGISRLSGEHDQNLLSTFMGHVNPQSTAVYLTITADLLTEASQRFERWADPLIHEVTR